MKVLLIEDRVLRKSQFLEKNQISLDEFSFLHHADPDEYLRIKKEIGNNDNSFLSSFDVILTHKSAFTINEQDLISSLKKSVVYFSGGVSQSYFSEYPSPCLHINSKEFYSPKLIAFLNHIKEFNEAELLLLEFGVNWKLNLLLGARDKLKQIIYRNWDADLYPEDFDGLINDRLINLIENPLLQKNLIYLKKEGMQKSEYNHIDEIFFALKKEIHKIINLAL